MRCLTSAPCSSSSFQTASFSEITDDRQRPLQAQPRIVVHQPAFGAGRVELAHLVAGFGLVPQHLVAVREALRHVERAVVVLGQFDGDVLQVSGTFGTQVDDDVEDRAPRARTSLVSAAGGNWKCMPRSVPFL